MAFEAIATLPLKLPEDCGAKLTLKDALCPGVRVRGVLNPEIVKPVPVELAWEIVTFSPPVFVKVSVCVWLVPTCTFPKVMLPGAALREPGTEVCVLCELGLLVLSPWHPSIEARASTTASAFQRAGRWRIVDRLSYVSSTPESKR